MEDDACIRYLRMIELPPTAGEVEIRSAITRELRLWTRRTNAPSLDGRQEAERVRDMARETHLAAGHFIYPLFIHHGEGTQPIASMPGCSRLGLGALMEEVRGAREDGVNALVLFPAELAAHKTSLGEASYDPEGLVQRAIRQLKAEWPDLTVVTDVALDPYSCDGHDGIVDHETGAVLNDETVDVLCKQALSHAEAGADIISPSDMMDGRVGAIRETLDDEGFTDVSILAYTVKYASGFYGPFRDALDSAPRFGDKKTYQMDPANVREGLREVELDEAEGADMIMVKPAGPFLDVIRAVREHTTLPVAAYQVSGEYAMLKAAAERGWLNERKVALESLMGIRRAGADVILTYYARQAARWLKEG